MALVIFGEIEFFTAVLATIFNIAGMHLFVHGQCALMAVAFITLCTFVVFTWFLEVIGEDAVLLQYRGHFYFDVPLRAG